MPPSTISIETPVHTISLLAMTKDSVEKRNRVRAPTQWVGKQRFRLARVFLPSHKLKLFSTQNLAILVLELLGLYIYPLA